MSGYALSTEGQRLRVALSGALDVDTATKLHDEVVEALDQAPPQEVLVDLCGLSDCSVFARSALVQLQTALRSVNGCRTAYVSNQPRFRGLALWVINLSEDPHARACMNGAIAENWLAGRESRLANVKARTVKALSGGSAK